jgi:hypothetical protein
VVGVARIIAPSRHLVGADGRTCIRSSALVFSAIGVRAVSVRAIRVRAIGVRAIGFKAFRFVGHGFSFPAPGIDAMLTTLPEHGRPAAVIESRRRGFGITHVSWASSG